MKCFYHLDNDGKCAGAIVKQSYPECEMVGMEYNMPFPLNIIEKNESVFMVDFTPDDVSIVFEIAYITNDFTWIDHHKTAIEKFNKALNAFTDEDAERFAVATPIVILDITMAGCLMTWKHLRPDEEIPDTVKYIGDYDTWKFEYGDDTRHFALGIGVLDLDPNNSMLWQKLLDQSFNPSEIIENGIVIKMYGEQKDREFFKKWAYDITWEGYLCSVMNRGMCGSPAFGNAINVADICVSYVFDGEKFTFSLYSKTVDVGEIAKKHGGGGHKGAAGFTSNGFPLGFRKVSEHLKKGVEGNSQDYNINFQKE